jgi:predicted nucleic acid-binding protein
VRAELFRQGFSVRLPDTLIAQSYLDHNAAFAHAR